MLCCWCVGVSCFRGNFDVLIYPGRRSTLRHCPERQGLIVNTVPGHLHLQRGGLIQWRPGIHMPETQSERYGRPPCLQKGPLSKTLMSGPRHLCRRSDDPNSSGDLDIRVHHAVEGTSWCNRYNAMPAPEDSDVCRAPAVRPTGYPSCDMSLSRKGSATDG